MDEGYGHTADQAEPIPCRGDPAQAWLIFRDGTGRIVRAPGENDPRPVDTVRGWARDWNAKGVAGWPHAWVLAAPTRPITAAALIAETLTYGAALKVMIQVRGDMWRVYAPSKATLLETLAKLPGEALAQIPLDGGYRYQCFGSRSAAFVPRAAGLFEIARSAPDPAIALFGQLIDAP